MKLTDFARQLPEDVWILFEPLLPPVLWCGNGCPPYSNRECLHAVFYVLVTGIGWRMCRKAKSPNECLIPLTGFRTLIEPCMM